MSKDEVVVSKIPKTLDTIHKNTRKCTVKDPETLQNGYKGTGYQSNTCRDTQWAHTYATAFLTPDVCH